MPHFARDTVLSAFDLLLHLLHSPTLSPALPHSHTCASTLCAQAEFGTISNISTGGQTVTFEAPLLHSHAAMIKSYPDTSLTLDARTEVTTKRRKPVL